MAPATGVVLEHPNRDTTAARAMRSAVAVLLLASALLVLAITVGGWDALAGAKGLQIAFAVLDVGLAALVLRWKRGVLPVAAALAVLLGIFAAVATPAWFARDRPGFTSPGLSDELLGLLCGALVPVQAVLVVAALQAFRQRWNVEVERPRATAGPAPA
jgi:hypothetical protein